MSNNLYRLNSLLNRIVHLNPNVYHKSSSSKVKRFLLKGKTYFDRLKKGTSSQITSISIATGNSPYISNIDAIMSEIEDVDQEINKTYKNLLDAQRVTFLSYINQPKGLLSTIQRQAHFTSSRESSNWHFLHLKRLLQRRLALQNRLDRITGKFWIKRLKLLVTLLAIGVAIFALMILMSTFLIPLLSLILICYLISIRRHK